MAVTIRPPAVAGTFMQADPTLLAREVDGYLHAGTSSTAAPRCPKVLIAPHAGHIYSGRTAARAYALLRPFGQLGSGQTFGSTFVPQTVGVAMALHGVATPADASVQRCTPPPEATARSSQT